MDSQPFITVYPTELHASPGGQVRFQFTGVGDRTVAYSVQCVEPGVASWCRVLLPAADGRAGELIVDVPDDAPPGRHPLRLVATAMGREVAAGELTLRIVGERCLRIVAAPTFSLEADGTVEVTLRVLNCGTVDAELVLRARHQEGWSFDIDAPELVIGVDEGPVTVKVVLRPDSRGSVDRGDRITIEVETGAGWQPLVGRIPGPRPVVRRAVALAAVVIAGVLAASVLADMWSDSGEEGADPLVADEGGPAGGPEDEDGEPGGGGPGTTDEAVEPVDIRSFTVDASGCDISVEWDAGGNPDGSLELYREGDLIEEMSVGPGSLDEPIDAIITDDSYELTYELIAYDSDGVETDSRSDSDGDQCFQVD